jgi:iron complex outermembrane recepter protein
VAGVINIITRKDYRGFVVGGDYERSTVSKKFGEGTVHATGGFGNYDTDRYNVLANIEFFKRDQVIWRDVLQYANPLTLAVIPKGNGQLSSFSYPGNVAGAPIASCDPALVIGGLCRYDRFTRFEAQPKADRVNLLVSGRLKISDSTEGFSEVLYSRTKTQYISPFATYGINPDVTWGDPSTNSARNFYYRGLPAGHPLNSTGDEAEFRYRFVDGPSEEKVTSDNYRVLAGLRGTYKTWDWESAVSLMGSKVDDVQRGAFSDSGFKEVIGDYKGSLFVDPVVPLDPDFFNKPGGYQIGQPNSAAVIDKLFPRFGYKAETKQIAIDGKISGEVMNLPAGPLSIATGFDLRNEKMDISPTANLLAGDIVGFGLVSSHAKRTFGAVFGELTAPVTKELEAQVAARIDKFPGFNAHLSPKLGLRYQPSKQLLLRGTVEGGFRAPNLTESATSTKFSFQNGVTDPQRCPQASALASDLRAQADALPPGDPAKVTLAARADQVETAECAGGVANITANNPNLKPEVSRSASLGLVFEPTKDLSFSVDYWNIHRKDEIGLKSTQELLAAEGALPPGSKIERKDPGADSVFRPDERGPYGVTVGQLSSIIGTFENVSRTKTEGFDIGANGRFQLGIGKLDVGFLSTYLKSYYSYSTVINAYGNNLAGTYGYPRVTATLSAALTTGPFVNGFRIKHSSPTKLVTDYFDTNWDDAGCAAKGIRPEDCRVGTTSRLDYFFSYTGVKNLTLGVYVRNMLNQFPAFDRRNLTDNGGNVIPQQQEDAQRRTLRLSMEYKFL